MEIGRQLRALAGRQLDRDRPVGLTKAVEVAPIRACRPRHGSLPKEVERDAGAAGAGSAGDDNVVIGLADAKREFDRADATLLTDEAVERPHLVGRFEAKGRRVAAPAQVLEAQRLETRAEARHLTRAAARRSTALSSCAQDLCGRDRS